MEVDVSEVLAAIGTLYDAQVHDKQKHDQASRWLGQLQRSVSYGAWAPATRDRYTSVCLLYRGLEALGHHPLLSLG